jgi:general stress protein YciG
MTDTSSHESMTVRDAGRKGGETTANRYGAEFYEEIGKKGGKKGGKALVAKYGKAHMAAIGRKGGSKKRPPATA